MKNYYYVFAFCFISVLTSCSRKNVVVSNDERYKIYSHQLESNYPSFVDETNPSAVPGEEVSASINNDYTIAPLADKRFEKTSISEKREIVTLKKPKTKAEKIEAYQAKVLDKLQTKRAEKLLRKQNTQEVSVGQLIAGIIVGTLGLILLGIAGATGAPVLVFVGGAVLFVAGIVLILIGVF